MEEQNIDAESVTRNKTYGAEEHLEHLLKIGYSPESPIIKRFVDEHNLKRFLLDCKSNIDGTRESTSQ